MPPTPTGFSGVRISRVSSASQSPMLPSCETMRVPGLSARSRGSSFLLKSGKRYIVTTLARAGSLRVLRRELHQVGIEIDAEAARAALRCFDHDAPVARAEIDHEVD